MTFKMNPEFENEILMSQELVDIVKDKGAEILDNARSFAAETNATGSFTDSIEGRFTRSAKGRPHYYVTAHDEAAVSIEFGTSTELAHRALGRAIREA
jgi:hypothetical protein